MVDKKSRRDVTSRLGRAEARKLLAEFFNTNPNNVFFSNHGSEEMQNRNLTSGDILNVLKAGNIYLDPEFEHGSWRYRIETRKITVVFAFNNPDKIRIVTAWRNV